MKDYKGNKVPSCVKELAGRLGTVSTDIFEVANYSEMVKPDVKTDFPGGLNVETARDGRYVVFGYYPNRTVVYGFVPPRKVPFLKKFLDGDVSFYPAALDIEIGQAELV